MKIGPINLQVINREPVKPAKTTGAGEQKAVPPGLERVQARQQSVPAADRNAGQATAAERISRNIARYAETQALGAPLADAAPPTSNPQTPTEDVTDPTSSDSQTAA
jgi:hypothetical protein